MRGRRVYQRILRRLQKYDEQDSEFHEMDQFRKLRLHNDDLGRFNAEFDTLVMKSQAKNISTSFLHEIYYKAIENSRSLKEEIADYKSFVLIIKIMRLYEPMSG